MYTKVDDRKVALAMYRSRWKTLRKLHHLPKNSACSVAIVWSGWRGGNHAKDDVVAIHQVSRTALPSDVLEPLRNQLFQAALSSHFCCVFLFEPFCSKALALGSESTANMRKTSSAEGNVLRSGLMDDSVDSGLS